MIGAACATDNTADRNPNQHWQLSIAYRKQRSHRHFVGTQEQHEREERGTEIVNDVHLFDVAVSYEFKSRYSLTASVPFMIATRTRPGTLDIPALGRPGPDQVSNAAGIGDMSVGFKAWVLDPNREERPRQNISFGIGVKLPTGNEQVTDTVQTATGPRTVVVDQSIQLGDGSWGFVLSTDMYKRLWKTTLYASGVYLFNPRNTNGVPTGRGRASEAIMSVTDAYLARGGVVFPIPKVGGWSASIGGRLEGVPVYDVFGKSYGFRRPGYAVSVDPGVNYYRRGDVWSLTVPIAVKRNRLRSVSDMMDGRHGDAAFADYLIVAGWTHRF